MLYRATRTGLVSQKRKCISFGYSSVANQATFCDGQLGGLSAFGHTLAGSAQPRTDLANQYSVDRIIQMPGRTVKPAPIVIDFTILD